MRRPDNDDAWYVLSKSCEPWSVCVTLNPQPITDKSSSAHAPSLRGVRPELPKTSGFVSVYLQHPSRCEAEGRGAIMQLLGVNYTSGFISSFSVRSYSGRTVRGIAKEAICVLARLRKTRGKCQSLTAKFFFSTFTWTWLCLAAVKSDDGSRVASRKAG